MNIIEAQKMMREMFPGKVITYEFDTSCLGRVNIEYREGRPINVCMMFYIAVLFDVNGVGKRRVPIDPHAVPGDTMDILKKHSTMEPYIVKEDLT